MWKHGFSIERCSLAAEKTLIQYIVSYLIGLDCSVVKHQLDVRITYMFLFSCWTLILRKCISAFIRWADFLMVFAFSWLMWHPCVLFWMRSRKEKTWGILSFHSTSSPSVSYHWVLLILSEHMLRFYTDDQQRATIAQDFVCGILNIVNLTETKH